MPQRVIWPWTEHDITRVKALAQKLPGADIAAQLGRSHAALVAKAHLLKLSLKMKSEESTRRMAESDFLTRDQFISLLLVADAQPIPAPIIPIDHEIRLIELGYIVNLQGLLRITTNGRIRTASIEAPDGQEKAAAGRRRQAAGL